MVDDEKPEGPPRRDQLLEEASLWFARMRGPDAEQHRDAFEAWVKLGAAHLGAYNRAGEIFALGRFLEQEAENADAFEQAGEDRRVNRWRLAALAASIVMLLGVGAWFARTPLSSLVSPRPEIALAPTGAPAGPKTFSSEDGAREVFKLADGSTVTLDGDSVLRVMFDREKRTLRLDRGRARFEVAHETRPFIVLAGDGQVTARGTIFDVILGANRLVTVRLLRGAVDVERPVTAQGGNKQASDTITRLAPGEELSFGRTDVPDLGVAPKAHEANLVQNVTQMSSLVEFDAAPLSSVIAEANRGAAIPIRVANPAIGALKVSGRFRVDDPAQVADRLATLFDLKVDQSQPGQIVLRSP